MSLTIHINWLIIYTSPPTPFTSSCVCVIYCSFQSAAAWGLFSWSLVLPRIGAVFIIVSLYELRSMAKGSAPVHTLFSQVCTNRHPLIPLPNKLQLIPKDEGFPWTVMTSSVCFAKPRSAGCRPSHCLVGSLGRFSLCCTRWICEQPCDSLSCTTSEIKPR